MNNEKKTNAHLKNAPTGSFPPLFKKEKETHNKKEEETKKRGFAQIKNALSIKEIMNERRDNNDFISL